MSESIQSQPRGLSVALGPELPLQHLHNDPAHRTQGSFPIWLRELSHSTWECNCQLPAVKEFNRPVSTRLNLLPSPKISRKAGGKECAVLTSAVTEPMAASPGCCLHSSISPEAAQSI